MGFREPGIDIEYKLHRMVSVFAYKLRGRMIAVVSRATRDINSLIRSLA